MNKREEEVPLEVVPSFSYTGSSNSQTVKAGNSNVGGLQSTVDSG